MIHIRKSKDRGHFDHGWLDTYHTFSFSDYQDPRFTGFRDLLVINEDRVEPGEGFGTHPHKNMEIITYILEGELEHKDSTGTGSVIRPGIVQRMTAGTGIRHSEFNHSKQNLVHLLQIWIIPGENGLKPGYEEKDFSVETTKNKLGLIVSPNGDGGALTIHQDAKIYAALLDADKQVSYELGTKRYGWVQVARGSIELNGKVLHAGDGAAISEEPSLTLIAKSAAEVLVFDLS